MIVTQLQYIIPRLLVVKTSTEENMDKQKRQAQSRALIMT